MSDTPKIAPALSAENWAREFAAWATHDMLVGLEALHGMGCPCGVITADDNARWEVAMREVPRLIAVLRALLPPRASLPEPPARV